MLNSEYKKQALKDLENENEKYNRKFKLLVDNIEKLHKIKLNSVDLLKNIELYINSIARRPKEIKKDLQETSVNYKKFENEIMKIELQQKKDAKVSGSVAGAGVAAGAGIAAFGPTAAMAIATTFGTASTGTAIATLSGAAATNAALAWLAGGALAVGGGGIGAGEALLALAGPVGWAIGGVALVGGGLLANSKNKKIAILAEQKLIEVKNEICKISKIDINVDKIKKETLDMKNYLDCMLSQIKSWNIYDYSMFNDFQKDTLIKFINITNALSRKICEKIS